jgi:hypothetical protein
MLLVFVFESAFEEIAFFGYFPLRFGMAIKWSLIRREVFKHKNQQAMR